MDLLERYLQAVRFFLPSKQQDDIVRELSENLIAEMEDRQQELGRALDEAEQAEILRRHGHPMLVAARYRSPLQLIGPVVFPVYLFTLKLGLGVALLVTVVLAVVSTMLHGDPSGQAVKAMLAFPGRGLMVFAWTTLVFAAFDIALRRCRISREWDPLSLPKVIRHEYQIPRMRTLGELLVSGVFIVWLLLLPATPFLILGPAAPLVEYASIWRLAYAPIVLLAFATAALHAIDFARPYWTRRRSLMQLAINGAYLVMLAVLLNAGEWFVPAATAPTLPEGVHVERIADLINAGFHIGFIVTGIIILVEIARELHRLRSRGSVPASPDSAAASRAVR